MSEARKPKINLCKERTYQGMSCQGLHSQRGQWDNLHYYPEVVPDNNIQQGGPYQAGQVARSTYLANIHSVGGNNFPIA